MPRWLCLLLIAGAVGMVLLPAALVLALRSDATHARVLGALLPRLEARLGRVELGARWEPGLRHWVLGPLVVQGPEDGDGPLLHAERVVVTPDWRNLFEDAPIRSVRLEEVSVQLGPGAERLKWLRAQLSSEGQTASTRETKGASRELPPLELKGLWLRLGEDAPLGPVEARLTPGRNGAAHSLEATWAEAWLSANLKRGDEGTWTIDAAWRAIPLSPLAAQLRPGLVTDGQSDGSLRLEGQVATFELKVRDGAVFWEPLDPAPVRPLDLMVEGRAAWDARARSLELSKSTLTLGADGRVRVPFSARLPTSAEAPFNIAAELPPTSLQALALSLPPALAPRTALKGVDGPVAASVEINGARADRSGWQVEARLDLDALRAAMRGRTTPLGETFVHHPLVDEADRGRSIRVGPGNPFFVPIGEVPHVLERAVLLSEDSFFYGHPGFDIPSLVRNLLQPREGTLRGGSTLTQQLAKNLYLSREKTYARKLREAFLTLALEASLPKARLLEIYLNVIEWGPDVFGLGEAAWHYFGKDARSLSTKEALFLATIIPNPIRYHGYCSRGELSERWEERLGELFDKMIGNGELDPLGAAIARHERLGFQHRAREDAWFEPLGLGLADGEGENTDPTLTQPAAGHAEEGDAEQAVGGRGLR